MNATLEDVTNRKREQAAEQLAAGEWVARERGQSLTGPLGGEAQPCARVPQGMVRLHLFWCPRTEYTRKPACIARPGVNHAGSGTILPDKFGSILQKNSSFWKRRRGRGPLLALSVHQWGMPEIGGTPTTG